MSGAPFLCGEERRAYRQDRLGDGSGKCALAVRTPLSASSARPPSPVAPSVPVGCLENEKTRNPSHISTETHTHTQSRGTNCMELAKGRIQPRKKRGWFPSPALDRSAFFFFFFVVVSNTFNNRVARKNAERERERDRGEKSWKEESGFSSIYY